MEKKTAEWKTVKVELASPIILSERGNDADIMVRINDNAYKASIRERYENGKNIYIVYVDGMDAKQLNALAVELDTDEIIAAHIKLVNKRIAERKAKENEQDTVVYRNWENLAKVLGCKLNYTLVEYLAKEHYDRRSCLCLQLNETYKNQKIEMRIDKDDEWYKVRIGYNRDDEKRTKHSSKLLELMSELNALAKARIDRAQSQEKAAKEGLSEVKAIFGEDVQHGEYGYRSGNREWHSEKVYEVSPKGDTWSAPKIQFQRTSDGKSVKYVVKKIEGYYTEAELKKILEVVRNAKVQK